MIAIVKGKEPEELLTYRLQKELNPSYDNMKGAKVSQFIEGGSDKNLYDIVLDSLAKEQGYICAYCMKRIPQNRRSPGMTIEHVNPQHKTDASEALNYRNMVAVCNGNRNASNNENKTCDAKRGTLRSEKQNLALNPLNPDTLRDLYYLENGEICSDNEEESRCINEVLNLNCEAEQLPDARREALETLQRKINENYPGRIAPKAYFRQLLERYRCAERKKPYVGILIAWLEKRV